MSRVSRVLKLGRLGDVSAGGDDWYVNIVTVDRRRAVVAMHAKTFVPGVGRRYFGAGAA